MFISNIKELNFMYSEPHIISEFVHLPKKIIGNCDMCNTKIKYSEWAIIHDKSILCVKCSLKEKIVVEHNRITRILDI